MERKLFWTVLPNGVIAQQSNSKIIKSSDGILAYQQAKNNSSRVIPSPAGGGEEWNRPHLRGNQHHVYTPWRSISINLTRRNQSLAQCRIFYNIPTAFIANERNVSITGEVYFEVAQNKSQPFKVHVTPSRTIIQVLGTQFNINAYSNEPATSTTLIEGSVKIISGNNIKILTPNQQSIVDSTGSIKLINDINIEEITAWKQGKFHFENAELSAILRQFSRWYDVEIIYEGNIPNRKFFAIVKRSRSLTNVLKLLQSQRY